MFASVAMDMTRAGRELSQGTIMRERESRVLQSESFVAGESLQLNVVYNFFF